MKIDVNTTSALSQVTPDRSAKQAATGSIGGSNSTEDRTTFNSDSNSVQTLTNQALQSPAVRQDKIDALRQSISTGQYQADPAKIASGIISSYSGVEVSDGAK